MALFLWSLLIVVGVFDALIASQWYVTPNRQTTIVWLTLHLSYAALLLTLPLWR